MNAREYYERAYEGDTRTSKTDILLTSSAVMAFLAAMVALVILVNPLSPLAMMSLSGPGPYPAIVRVEPAGPPAVAAEPAAEPVPALPAQAPTIGAGGVVMGVSVAPAQIREDDEDEEEDEREFRLGKNAAPVAARQAGASRDRSGSNRGRR